MLIDYEGAGGLQFCMEYCTLISKTPSLHLAFVIFKPILWPSSVVNRPVLEAALL